jgi:hypothetical protein
MKISFNTAKLLEPQAIEALETASATLEEGTFSEERNAQFFAASGKPLEVVIYATPMTKMSWSNAIFAWRLNWMC